MTSLAPIRLVASLAAAAVAALPAAAGVSVVAQDPLLGRRSACRSATPAPISAGPDGGAAASRQGALAGVYLTGRSARGWRSSRNCSSRSRAADPRRSRGGGTAPLDIELAYLEMPVLAKLSLAVRRAGCTLCFLADRPPRSGSAAIWSSIGRRSGPRARMSKPRLPTAGLRRRDRRRGSIATGPKPRWRSRRATPSASPSVLGERGRRPQSPARGACSRSTSDPGPSVSCGGSHRRSRKPKGCTSLPSHRTRSGGIRPMADISGAVGRLVRTDRCRGGGGRRLGRSGLGSGPACGARSRRWRWSSASTSWRGTACRSLHPFAFLAR